MKLLVLGATGGIGLKIVAQALERGHAVTAVVRSANPLREFDGRVAVNVGNLLDSGTLASAMNGQDVVLSAFGPRVPIANTDAHLLRDFAAALTPAMMQSGIRYGLIVSTAFLFRDAVLPPAYLIGRLFFSGVVADATDMEKILGESKAHLTIVRPPQLTDKPFTGKYRVREGHLPLFGFSISRANVADFMVRTAERGSFPAAVAGIAE